MSVLLHTPCWQEVGPDVDRLVVHLEAAQDAVQRWAPRVTVSRDDAVLPEHLRINQTHQVSGKISTPRLWSTPFGGFQSHTDMYFEGNSENFEPKTSQAGSSRMC